MVEGQKRGITDNLSDLKFEKSVKEYKWSNVDYILKRTNLGYKAQAMVPKGAKSRALSIGLVVKLQIETTSELE